MKYNYPMVLKYDEDDDRYYVSFPGFPNCFTDGKTFEEALDMGRDVLSLMLCQVEDNGTVVPEPTDMKDIELGRHEIASLTYIDTDEYRRSCS